jgi:DNA-binding IclR family transcriptional regulator
MTKLEVLRIFARTGRFMKPDDVWRQLGCGLDRRSLYSYLDRLRKQGLLQRGPRRQWSCSCCTNLAQLITN